MVQVDQQEGSPAGRGTTHPTPRSQAFGRRSPYTAEIVSPWTLRKDAAHRRGPGRLPERETGPSFCADARSPWGRPLSWVRRPGDRGREAEGRSCGRHGPAQVSRPGGLGLGASSTAWRRGRTQRPQMAVPRRAPGCPDRKIASRAPPDAPNGAPAAPRVRRGDGVQSSAAAARARPSRRCRSLAARARPSRPDRPAGCAPAAGRTRAPAPAGVASRPILAPRPRRGGAPSRPACSRSDGRPAGRRRAAARGAAAAADGAMLGRRPDFDPGGRPWSLQPSARPSSSRPRRSRDRRPSTPGRPVVPRSVDAPASGILVSSEACASVTQGGL